MSREEFRKIEEAVARSFMRSNKKERIRGLLPSNRGRAKFLGELYHFYDFDSRWEMEIPMQ